MPLQLDCVDEASKLGATTLSVRSCRILLIFHLCPGVAANKHVPEIKHARFPDKKLKCAFARGNARLLVEKSIFGGKWPGSK